jgi:protoporphyrinogen IX oxidase
MAWLKALHIVSLLIWSASLFYLPGLFALHPETRDPDAFRRLRAMTRITYVAIASPAAVLAVASGTALIPFILPFGAWLIVKLTVVSLMVLFHIYCGYAVAWLHDTPAHASPRRHLSLCVAPVVLIPTVLWLVLGKPF